MTIGHFSDMTQFLQEFEGYGTNDATIKVTYLAYGDADKVKTIRIPLVPDTEKLESFHVNMHNSPTDAYQMDKKYSQWFTECFGYDVVFVYIGDSKRPVIFEDMQPLTPDPLTAFFKKNIPFLGKYVEELMGIRQTEQWRIKFQDCAPFLITSKTSLEDVSSRLGEGLEMDMIKFRPNIVIEGANEPWQEDYWGKIKINQKTEMIMAHNCVRCKSINLDYDTGKPGVGASGEVLKKMQKDRRIDIGAKWSPVFGRYTFWAPNAPKSQTIKVGDRVNVTKVNEGLTIWSKFSLCQNARLILTTCRLAWFGLDISHSSRSHNYSHYIHALDIKSKVTVKVLQLPFLNPVSSIQCVFPNFWSEILTAIPLSPSYHLHLHASTSANSNCDISPTQNCPLLVAMSALSLLLTFPHRVLGNLGFLTWLSTDPILPGPLRPPRLSTLTLQ